MILNLTPHTVTVAPDGGEPTHIFPPHGLVARVEMRTEPAPPAPGGCPTATVRYGRADLPEVSSTPDAYIVSTMFAQAYRAQHGSDGVVLLVPDTGPSARREGDRIRSVKHLLRY